MSASVKFCKRPTAQPMAHKDAWSYFLYLHTAPPYISVHSTMMGHSGHCRRIDNDGVRISWIALDQPLQQANLVALIDHDIPVEGLEDAVVRRRIGVVSPPPTLINGRS